MLEFLRWFRSGSPVESTFWLGDARQTMTELHDAATEASSGSMSVCRMCAARRRVGVRFRVGVRVRVRISFRVSVRVKVRVRVNQMQSMMIQRQQQDAAGTAPSGPLCNVQPPMLDALR